MRRTQPGDASGAREATHVQLSPYSARADRAARLEGRARGCGSRRGKEYSIQPMSQAPSVDKAPPKPAVTADGSTLRQLEEEGVAEALAAVASKNAVVETAEDYDIYYGGQKMQPPATRGAAKEPAKLSFQDMLGLKVNFKCAPARATEVTGETEVIVDARLWQLLQHSQVIADTVSTCADSITAEGVTINAPGVPADAARTVLDVLLKQMTARMWYEIDTFACTWDRVDTGGGVQGWKRKESSFDWVDKETYRFIDMFQFESLRTAVDAFVTKYPTMDTIAARDAVSPTDAEWASEREIAKVAEFLFYDDETEPRSSTRLLVERYLKELSAPLLARVMCHIAWDARFKHNHGTQKISRGYSEGVNVMPKLVVKDEWKTQLLHNGPLCSR